MKIGINGFGRIGRNVFKSAFMRKDIEIIAINDLTDPATLAHLLQYDSVFGKWGKNISVEGASLVVDGKQTKVLSTPQIDQLNWKEHEIDVVIESTGRYTDGNIARSHIAKGGASKVIISAPAKNEDITIVLGVNEKDYDSNHHHVISNASCTTNCLAPLVKVLLDNLGFKKGFMSTIHSYTNDQKILDLPHKDLRRARAAALSMIPTTTGAAKAVSLVLPQVKGILDGMAIRVPTPDVSVVDLTAEIEEDTSKEKVNELLKKASQNELQGILEFCELPLVSSDFLGNPASSIVDGLSTSVVDNRLVKIISWYDNEWGYSNRIVDFVKFISK